MTLFEIIRAGLESGLQRDLEPAYAALVELERERDELRAKLDEYEKAPTIQSLPTTGLAP